jgi:hypothetical protein
MPGLVPGIHVLDASRRKSWMAGTSPAMTRGPGDLPVGQNPVNPSWKKYSDLQKMESGSIFLTILSH